MGLVDANCHYYQAQLAGGGEGYDLFDVVLGQGADCCEKGGDSPQA